MPNILLVEDKASLRKMLATALEKEGHSVTAAPDGNRASDLIRQRDFHLILTDLRLPHRSGIEVLKTARETDPRVPVLIMTAYGTIEEAVRAMKLGAFDFIPKPVDIAHLVLLVERALERRRLVLENTLLKDEVASAQRMPRIIGESPAIKDLVRQIGQVAATDATVLLTGESGTGKEVFSRAIHLLGKRRERPFVTVNCAAIPSELIENELFGHEKGAYTGASERKIGKSEYADQGTIFLDEIGDLDISVQAKILRVIEDRIFERIGGLKSIQVDTRIIAATNRDLKKLVAEKAFREDLFFRLSVVPIEVPPLRRRLTDIPLLARFFVDKFAGELHRSPIELSDGALAALEEYSWPGNVRELQNSIERAVILSEGPVIGADDLSFAFVAAPLDGSGQLGGGGPGGIAVGCGPPGNAGGGELKICQVLERTKWNKTQAAKLLGVSYKTLLNKIKLYELG